MSQVSPQCQAPHAAGGIERLGDTYERDLVAIEGFDNTGKVHQASRQPVDLVDDNDIDPAFPDILEQLLQGRSFHIAAGPATIVIVLRQTFSTFTGLG